MEVYLDRKNLIAFAKRQGSEEYKECLKILKHSQLYCSFSSESIKNGKKSERVLLRPFVTAMTRGVEDSPIEWDYTFPTRPLEINCHEQFNIKQLQAVYLVEDDNVEDVKSKGGVLIGNVGEEVSTLSKLSIYGDFIPTKKKRIRDFTDWSVIKENTCPCTDIIIEDPFFFAQSEWELEYNCLKIIEHLSQHANGLVLNIVFITDAEFKNGSTRQPVLWSSISKKIREVVRKTTGCEPNLTWVKIPQRWAKKMADHDRTIFTNYKMFDSGDSFTYFNEGGDFSSGGEWFHITSLAYPDEGQIAIDFISDMQTIVDEVKTGLNSIEGDKVSNFLNFS